MSCYPFNRIPKGLLAEKYGNYCGRSTKAKDKTSLLVQASEETLDETKSCCKKM